MGRGETVAAIKKILDFLSSNPYQKFSVQEISKESGVSWDCTKRYLELFVKLKFVKDYQDNSKVLYQKIRQYQSDTLFSIPLKEDHKVIIKRTYATIKEVWKNISNNKPLTKTLVQKIAVDFIEKKYSDIPRGWYLYGELLLLPFNAEESYKSTFTDKGKIEALKEICTNYLPYYDRSYKIRQHQYEEKGKKLYLIKEYLYYHLAHAKFNDVSKKNKIRQLLNDFAINCERRESNSTILAIVEDFCSESLAIFRHGNSELLEKARPSILEVFNAVWQLVATYELYDSLITFYDKDLLQSYLFDKIRDLEEIAVESLEGLREFRPNYEYTNDESSQKLKDLMGSAKELSLEDKEKILKELKGNVPSYVRGKFGLD